MMCFCLPCCVPQRVLLFDVTGRAVLNNPHPGVATTPVTARWLTRCALWDRWWLLIFLINFAGPLYLFFFFLECSCSLAAATVIFLVDQTNLFAQRKTDHREVKIQRWRQRGRHLCPHDRDGVSVVDTCVHTTEMKRVSLACEITLGLLASTIHLKI